MPKLAHILAGAAMLTLPAAAIAQEAQPAPTTTTNTPAGASAAATAAAPAAQLGADGKVVLAEGTPVVDTQGAAVGTLTKVETRSEEHTSELQSLMRISYAVFCLKKKTYTY